MRPLTIEGNFRVVPRDWGLKTFESGALAVNIRFEVVEEFQSGGTWRKWPAHDPREVSGDFFLLKRDGKPNEKLVKSLAAALGWPGDLAALDDPQSQFRACQVDVREEVYNNASRMKAVWIHHWDHQPRSSISQDELRTLESRHGDALRALAGPEVAEASAAPAQPAPAAASYDEALPPPTGDDIPF